MTQQVSTRSLARFALDRGELTSATPAAALPQREITQRRQDLNNMYEMIHGVTDGGTIVGEGFYIRSDGEHFEVFRRGLGTQHVVKSVARVAALFTTSMFFGGIVR